MEQPSTKPGGGGGGGRGGDRKEREEQRERPDVSKLIHRFRHAPPTSRAAREADERAPWWKEGHPITPSHQHPQHHSTPTSGTSKAELSVRVSSEDSLEERSRSLIEKSSSILSGSSLPAQKYFNSKKTPAPQQGGNSGKPGPTLQYSFAPLRNLPLNPEEDILYQWRLRRRLELAREEAGAVAEEGRRFRGGRGRGWRCGLLQRDLGEQDERHRGGVRAGEDARHTLAAEEEDDLCCVHYQTALVCGHTVPSNTLEQHRVVPPVTHHASLQCPCKGAVPPHMHTSCDVIPCPCRRRREPKRAEGQEGMAGPAHRRRAGGKRHSGNGGSRSDGAERSRGQPRDLRTGQEEGGATVNARTLKTTTHDPVPCESQSSNFPVGTAGDDSTLHQLQPPNEGGYHGAHQSAPVQYPSPSVLTRHRSRTKHHKTTKPDTAGQHHPPDPPPARETTRLATQSDSEADSLAADSLHLSLSSSPEADQTLTPGGREADCRGGAGGEQSVSPAEGGTSITPVVSKAVGQRLFGSPPPSPRHPLPPKGSPASKETLTQLSPEVEICWEEDYGDRLLMILIAKAKLFEDQLWEIDRLLSALSSD